MSNPQDENDLVRIVLGIYDPQGTYARHAGAVMASIFLTTRSRVIVHILHDSTLTEENRARLRETAERFGQSADFVDVSGNIDRLGTAALRTAGKFLSVGCLFRLLIPDLLPHPKIIYLDCDVLVNLDIRELWDVDLEGNCIGGVRDPKTKKKRRLLSRDYLISRLTGTDLADYVNSGVLVMDLDRIRVTCDLTRKASAWFARYAHCAPPIDQNFINAVFHKKCRILDARFNRNSTEPGDKQAILHVMGKPKPWQGFNDRLAGEIYWRSLAETAWKDETLDALLDTAFGSAFNHRKTAQCHARIRERLYRDLFARNLSNLRGICRILWKELLFRVGSVPGRASR